jgi:hypothetical protein
MRTAIPRLKELAKGEVEKGAILVSVYRMGRETLMARGRLPHLKISRIALPYLVCAVRRDELRIYLCDEAGRIVLGDNLRGEEMYKFMRRIDSCRRLFSLRRV